MLSSTNRAFIGDDGASVGDQSATVTPAPAAVTPVALTPSPVPSSLSSPLRCRVYEIATHRASFDASVGSASVTLPPTPRPGSSASTAAPLKCRVYEIAKYRAEPLRPPLSK